MEVLISEISSTLSLHGNFRHALKSTLGVMFKTHWGITNCWELKRFFSWFLSSSTLEWERTEKGNVVKETWSLWGGGGGGGGWAYHTILVCR